MTESNIFVAGFVQGVGFRKFVKSKARSMGLKGWVKNLSDGRVEALVQGDKEKIEELIKFCEQGPMLSDVKNVTVSWIDSDRVYKDFEIL